MKELRELIRELREDHDLKQKEVARYLHVSQQTYSNYERGRRDIPVFVVVELAKYYKVSADYLLGVEMDCPGSTNLKRPYLDHITYYDVLYDIQKLERDSRKDLVRYISYLKAIPHCEEEYRKRQAIGKGKRAGKK